MHFVDLNTIHFGLGLGLGLGQRGAEADGRCGPRACLPKHTFQIIKVSRFPSIKISRFLDSNV